jgi:hypothetical protein
MSIGKVAGDFSFAATSVTNIAAGGAGNGGSLAVNYEGGAEGFGAVLATMTFTVAEAGDDHGTTTWVGTAYKENGDIVSGTGIGVFVAAGGHTWKTRSMVTLSDGTVLLSEGLVTLADKSYKGKIYAWE